MRMASLSALLLLAACGAPISDDALPAEDAGDEVAAAAARATLVFGADWSVSQRGPLVAGSTFQVQYAPARLPGCRGNNNNGGPAWTITGYYSVAGGPAKSFYTAGFSPTGSTAAPVLSLPRAGDLAVWFQVTNRWGCSAYDSNFGHNFHFSVRPAS